MRFSQILAKFAVSLFTREWIEIDGALVQLVLIERLPLYEGVD